MNNLEFSQRLLELVREIEKEKGSVKIEDIYEYLLNQEKEFVDTVEQDEDDSEYETDFAQLVEKDVYDDDGNQIGHYYEATYFDNSFIQD